MIFFLFCAVEIDSLLLLLFNVARPWQVVVLIADTRRRSLLMAGDDDEMFMTRSLNVTPKNNRTAFSCTQ